MVKWPDEWTRKFVNEYVRHECLWDTRSELYKNRYARKEAYAAIEEIMAIEGFDQSQVVQKIKNIRSTYSQELRKIKDSRESGAGPGSMYIPQLKWFHIMDNALQKLGEATLNIQVHEALSDDEGEPIEEQVHLPKEERVHLPKEEHMHLSNEDCMHLAMEERVHLLSEEHAYPVALSTAVGAELHMNGLSGGFSNKRRKVEEQHSVLTQVKSSNDVISNSQEENEFDVFGRLVGLQLKGMPLPLAFQAQQQIQTCLTQLRLQHLVQSSTQNPTHTVTLQFVPAPANSQVPPAAPELPPSENSDAQ